MPRNSLGIPMVASSVGGAIINVNDVLWESFGVNEIAINYAENYTNIVLHSQDVTDAEAWTKAATSIDSTLYEAPDNSTTANAIKSNNTGSRNYKITQSSLTLTTGKTYTASVHVKKGTLGFARVKSHDGSAPFKADFNLTTGAVTHTSNTIRTQVDAMDDDWYRCSITFQATATTSSAYFEVFALSTAGDSTPNVAVSGVVLLYVWGFQLEENIEASPYIVTTTEARTATETLNDLSSIWDFDSADLMPQETPNSEGVWETSDNLVLNHDYEELGSEQLTNGGFSNGENNWSFGTGWSIIDGKATVVNQTGWLTSTGAPILANKQIKLQFDVVLNGGTLRVKNNTNDFDETFNTVGSYTITRYYSTGGSASNLQFPNYGSGFSGSIDNVSVKEVDPNDRWTLTGGTSISDGKMTVTGASGTSIGFQSMLVQGTTYELTYTISNFSLSSGDTKIIDDDGNTIQNISANGTFTVIFTHAIASGNLIFRATSGTNSYQVDDVIVKEYAITPLDV